LPRVLLVLLAAVELEEHAEAARVDLVAPAFPRETRERSVGDERDRSVHAGAGAVRARETHRSPGELRQRLLPWPLHDAAVHVDRPGRRMDRLTACCGIALDTRAVGEVHAQ